MIFFPSLIVQCASNCAISMQTQVAEYKQLKDTLNKIPSFRKSDQTELQNVTLTQMAHSPQGYNTARRQPTGKPQGVRGTDCWWSMVRPLSLCICHKMNCSPQCPLCRVIFSNFSVCQNLQQGLLRHRLLSCSQCFRFSSFGGEACRFALLTDSAKLGRTF